MTTVQCLQGYSALSEAARRGFTEVVRLLLSNGADVNPEVNAELGNLCQLVVGRAVSKAQLAWQHTHGLAVRQ